jgi:nucleotide-binding universal stress UspA family protein
MGGGIPADLIDVQRTESEGAAQRAVSRLDEAARRAGISFETRQENASAAGAADRFGHMARRFDLAVVGQPQPDSPVMQDLVLETALFETGRPVIAVPYINKGEMTLERVVICWDGGRTAARAIGDAIPFLSRAKQVEVLIVAGERGKRDELPGVDLGQHLARHGLKITVNRIPAGDVDPANAIISYIADSGTDFMVMGGYGHSRLREFVLGGVTRTVLQSMTVPVLMSH